MDVEKSGKIDIIKEKYIQSNAETLLCNFVASRVIT